MDPNSSIPPSIVTQGAKDVTTPEPQVALSSVAESQKIQLKTVVVTMAITLSLALVIATFVINLPQKAALPAVATVQGYLPSPTITQVSATPIPLASPTEEPKATPKPEITYQSLSNSNANAASPEYAEKNKNFLVSFLNTQNHITSYIGLFAVFDNGKGYNIIAHISAEVENGPGEITEYTFWAEEDNGPDRWEKNTSGQDSLSAQISVASKQKGAIYFAFKDDKNNIQQITIAKSSLDKAMGMPPIQ